MSCDAVQDDDVYCHNCGSDSLAYIETYANGASYKCIECGETITGVRQGDEK